MSMNSHKDMAAEITLSDLLDSPPASIWWGHHHFFEIGPFSISIAADATAYCFPRTHCAALYEYDSVEIAILMPFSRKISSGLETELMSVSMISDYFGKEVGDLCAPAFSEDGPCVMPYVEWADVVYVANKIRQKVLETRAHDDTIREMTDWNDEVITAESQGSCDWDDEECQPF